VAVTRVSFSRELFYVRNVLNLSGNELTWPFSVRFAGAREPGPAVGGAGQRWRGRREDPQALGRCFLQAFKAIWGVIGEKNPAQPSISSPPAAPPHMPFFLPPSLLQITKQMLMNITDMMDARETIAAVKAQVDAKEDVTDEMEIKVSRAPCMGCIQPFERGFAISCPIRARESDQPNLRCSINSRNSTSPRAVPRTTISPTSSKYWRI
jgi:hypothetical protein